LQNQETVSLAVISCAPSTPQETLWRCGDTIESRTT
jgi:hypothetical protein